MDFLYYLCPSAPAGGPSGQQTKMLVIGTYYLGVCTLFLIMTLVAASLPSRINRRKGPAPAEYVCRIPLWPDIILVVACAILAVGISLPTLIDPVGLSGKKFLPLYGLAAFALAALTWRRLHRPHIRLTGEGIEFNAANLCRQRYKPAVPFSDIVSVENQPKYFRIKLRIGHPISISRIALQAYRGYNYIEQVLADFPSPSQSGTQEASWRK